MDSSNMKYERKSQTFEFHIFKPEDVETDFNKQTSDNRFLRVRIGVAHTGVNANGSSFSRDILENMVRNARNIPIVAYIDENSGDFTDHREEVQAIINAEGEAEMQRRYLGQAYGVVPERNNWRFMDIVGNDGVSREFAVVDGFLWNKWGEAIDIFNGSGGVKGQSMELHEDFDGHFDGDGIFHFTRATIEALTMLGDDVEPAMNGARVSRPVRFNKEIKDQFQQMYAELSSMGINYQELYKAVNEMDNKKEVVVEKNGTETETETKTETKTEEKEISQDFVEEKEEVKVETKTETEGKTEEKEVSQEFKKEVKVETEEDLKEVESKKATMSPELAVEFARKNAENENLKAQTQKLIQKINKLEDEVWKYRHAALRAEKIECIQKYKDILTQEEIDSLIKNFEYMEIPEIEAEVGKIALKKIQQDSGSSIKYSSNKVVSKPSSKKEVQETDENQYGDYSKFLK